MKKLRSPHFYTIFCSVLFLFPYTMLSVYKDEVYISQSELHEILENTDRKYVYLGRELSDLYDVMLEVSEFDEDKNSVVWQLRKHIEDGYSIGLHDMVMEALEHAANLLQTKNSVKDQLVADALMGVMDQVLNEALTPIVTELDDEEIDGTRKQSSSYPSPTIYYTTDSKKYNNHANVQRNRSVNNNKVINVREKLKAFDDAIFKHNVRIDGSLVVDGHTRLHEKLKVFAKAVFKEDAKFEEDVLIEGDLTVEGTVNFSGLTVISLIDVVIENLSATDIFVENLSATNATIANLTVTNCMTSLCVNDLSVVDESVSGTLSVNDAIINNATITNLSIVGCLANLCVNNLSVVNESVSGTLSVTDLVVTNCIPSLCVIDLSAVDVSISGTLSVNDIVVPSLSLCDITVGCDIKMTNSTDAAHGNILKGGNSFLSNFGTDNTFVGINSGNFTMAGTENSGFGNNTLLSNTTGFDDVAIGSFALVANTIGADNDAIGAFSMANNTAGNQNVGVGSYTLLNNTTGSGNTALGFQAGYSLATGNNNVLVGNAAASFATAGSTNVIIGYNAGVSLTTGDNNIYLSNPGAAVESGIIRIGTVATHTAAFIQGIFPSVVGGTGIPVFVDATGQLGTVVSSRRFKHDIEDMTSDISQNIYKLRPVTFVYNSDESDAQQYGLIAEEVAQVLPALVVHDEEGVPYTVRYHILPMLLLNEVQKLNSIIQDQAITINALKSDNKKFGEIIETVIAKINGLNH